MKWLALALFMVGLVATGDNANEAAVKKEWAKLEGTYDIVAKEANGEKADEDSLKELGQVTFKDGKFTWSGGAGGTMVINPTKKPKEVDYAIVDGQGMVHLYKGIYELEGDTFKDCYAPPGAERPTEFKSPAGSENIIMVHKRVKEEKKDEKKDENPK